MADMFQQSNSFWDLSSKDFTMICEVKIFINLDSQDFMWMDILNWWIVENYRQLS